MKRFAAVILALGLALAARPGTAEAQVHAGIGLDRDGVHYIHLALGEVYGAPIGALPSWVHPEELPVIYLLAHQARVSPHMVLALRQRGWSWLDITYHLGLYPGLFVARLPYGHGYWGKRSGRDYRYLTDRHIIDYVNLFFWADYHRRPVTRVIVLRQQVPSWTHLAKHHAPLRTRGATPRAHAPPVVRGHTAPPVRQPETRPEPRRPERAPAVRQAGSRGERTAPPATTRGATPTRAAPPPTRATPAPGGSRDEARPAPRGEASPPADRRGGTATPRSNPPPVRASPGSTRGSTPAADRRGSGGSRGEARPSAGSRRGGGRGG